MFTAPSAALAILALIVGLVDTIRRGPGYWWVVTGLIAGAACWSAPAYPAVHVPGREPGVAAA